MKKIIYLTGIMICFALLAQAQINTTEKNPYGSSIFFELGGPGLASANYDMRFNKKGEGLGFRVGIGGVPSSGINLLIIPVGLNYIISKDARNYFEMGAGFSVISAKEGDMSSDMFHGTFGHTTFGYRLQPKNGGFCFRASLNPIFSGEGLFPFYGGIGFGWKF